MTDEAIRAFDSNLRVNPPIRTEKDVEKIIEGLKDGTIDAIVTDHAPHSIEEKDVEFSPRRILKLPVPEIKEGEKANISILDQNLEWKVDKSTFKSNSRNTPFDNWTLIGKAFGVYNHGIWCCEM